MRETIRRLEKIEIVFSLSKRRFIAAIKTLWSISILKYFYLLVCLRTGKLQNSYHEVDFPKSSEAAVFMTSLLVMNNQ